MGACFQLVPTNLPATHLSVQTSLPACSSASTAVTPPSVGLVRKLVSVLEVVEKLPVFTHDPPGQMLNLQVTDCAVSSAC